MNLEPTAGGGPQLHRVSVAEDRHTQTDSLHATSRHQLNQQALRLGEETASHRVNTHTLLAGWMGFEPTTPQLCSKGATLKATVLHYTHTFYNILYSPFALGKLH